MSGTAGYNESNTVLNNVIIIRFFKNSQKEPFFLTVLMFHNVSFFQLEVS